MSEPTPSRPSCPLCKAPLVPEGTLQRCPSCQGAWVAEDTLVAILEQRAAALGALPWQAREGTPRPCARCGASMQTVKLGTVALDRCAAHGVWLDTHELSQLEDQAPQLGAPREPRHETLLRKLMKLLTVS